MKGSCSTLSFFLAATGLSINARSISGKVQVLPDPLGNSNVISLHSGFFPSGQVPSNAFQSAGELP